MSLVDDAKRLERVGPYLIEGSHCELCGRVIVGFAHIAPEGHDAVCPVRSWPRIVAALEAADRVVRTFERHGYMDEHWKNMGALVATLAEPTRAVDGGK